jgi:hypothetical protein
MSEKSLEMRHFQDFVRLEEPGVGPFLGCRNPLGMKK